MGAPDNRRAAARTIAADAALTLVASDFEAARIPAVLLRGPAIAARLYDPGEDRHYGDVDLLVPRERLAAARRRLLALGFTQRSGGMPELQALWDHAETWESELRGTSIDLHHRVWGIDHLAWQVLGEHTRAFRCGDALVAAPDDAGIALLVALHAAQHGVGDERVMVDLSRALTRLPAAAWAEAARRARSAGATRRMAVGLSLDPSGRAMAARVGIHGTAESSVEILMAGASPRGSVPVARIAELPARARPRALARQLVPSRATMRAQWPESRAGARALLRAHAKRLWGIARDLPTAWRAWRAAEGRLSEAQRLPMRGPLRETPSPRLPFTGPSVSSESDPRSSMRGGS